MDEQDRRQAAIERIKAKRDFGTHLVAYLVVNGFLIGVWYFTNTAYFWPIWPLLGWGIGLVLHGWETFRSPISEAAIEREMRRQGPT